jgi:hypothetical protein
MLVGIIISRWETLVRSSDWFLNATSGCKNISGSSEMVNFSYDCNNTFIR